MSRVSVLDSYCNLRSSSFHRIDPHRIADMFNIRASAVSKLSSELNRSNSAIVKRREKELKRQQMNGAIIYVLQ